MLHYLKPAHGFKTKRNQERFVDVEFRHRELFAYTCEAYARAAAIRGRRRRISFAAAMSEKAHSFSDDMRAGIGDLLLRAAIARNGCKVIQESTRIRSTKWRAQLQSASAAVSATLVYMITPADSTQQMCPRRARGIPTHSRHRPIALPTHG
jgi:hypothetical protein